MPRGTRERSRGSLQAFVYRTFTFCGRPFQTVRLATTLLTPCRLCRADRMVPRPRPSNACRLALDRFGLFPVRSPLLGESLTCFLFLGVLRCFSSPGWPSAGYVFTRRLTACAVRLPDSGISGSTPVSGFPELFAAVHALHRLSTPRHSPCALSSLTYP